MALSRGRKAAITRQNNAKTLKAKARLNRIIKNIPIEIRNQIRADLADAARSITNDMRERVPVASGDLQDSITWRYGDQERIAYSQGAGGDNELSVRISAGNDYVRYAHLVEFGTSSAPAQPYFYPAIRGNKRQIDRAMSGALRKAIAKAKKG